MADSDEPFEVPDLEGAVESGSRLDVLKAMALIAAHELEGNRCSKCQSSVMKMGEISSLMLRLQKLVEDIEAGERNKNRNGSPDSEGGQKKGGLRGIQRDYSHLRVVGDADSPDPGLPSYGTKAAPRRQGGRKPRGGSSRSR